MWHSPKVQQSQRSQWSTAMQFFLQLATYFRTLTPRSCKTLGLTQLISCWHFSHNPPVWFYIGHKNNLPCHTESNGGTFNSSVHLHVLERKVGPFGNRPCGTSQTPLLGGELIFQYFIDPYKGFFFCRAATQCAKHIVCLVWPSQGSNHDLPVSGMPLCGLATERIAW